MAIAFGALLGEQDDGSGTLVTIAAVPAGAKIVALMDVYSPPAALTTISGGGLTWAIDMQMHSTLYNGWRVALASADAPAGLASGTTITVYKAPGTDFIHMQAFYMTGAATSSYVDVTADNASTGTFPINITTTFADDMIVVAQWSDTNPGNHTPAAGSTEMYDKHAGWDITYTSSYRVVSATGTYSVGSTNVATAPGVLGAVAYKAASGESPPAGPTMFRGVTRSPVTLR